MTAMWSWLVKVHVNKVTGVFFVPVANDSQKWELKNRILGHQWDTESVHAPDKVKLFLKICTPLRNVLPMIKHYKLEIWVSMNKSTHVISLAREIALKTWVTDFPWRKIYYRPIFFFPGGGDWFIAIFPGERWLEGKGTI